MTGSHNFKVKVGYTDAALKDQLRYYNSMFQNIIKHRPQTVVDQQNLLHHILLLNDIFEPELAPPKTLRITSLELSFLIQEWLSFMLCNYLGAYSAAARTLRWIYESTVASTVALINASLLLGKTVTRPLTYAQFRTWLWQYDHHKVKFPRKEAIKLIGLPPKDQPRYDVLYSSLCKYSHISAKHFIPPKPTPDLVLNLDYFDAVSRYGYRTIDLAIFCIIKAIISQWDTKQVRDFFQSYFDWYSARQILAVKREKFPLTVGLLKHL